MSIFWEAGGASDVGLMRAGNEDAFFLDPERGVFVIADGMGGHAAGEVASGLAVRAAADALVGAVDSEIPPAEIAQQLSAAFRHAWEEISRSSRDDPTTDGMGTTLTACLLSPAGWCRIGHIGDTRVYRIRDGEMELLTEDHTWVQREVDAGRLAHDAAETHPFAHVLTRVLSADLSPEPDLLAPTFLPGDAFLLTSDGLHGLIPPAVLRQIVTSDAPVSAVLSTMIEEANRRGGRDNITAILVRTSPAHSAVASHGGPDRSPCTTD